MSNYVIGHWNRAKASIGGALSLLRDEYYADSVSLAYYAILHAAKAALQLYGVSTESHSGVHRMFALHLIRPEIVEPEWGDDIRQSADRRLLSNYDVTTTFDETDARESCERAQAVLDRIRILLGDALPAEDE